MSLIVLNSVTPEHKFVINITIDDSDNTTFNFKMLSAPVFEYGNDEDIDTILYPSNCKIEFTIAASYVPQLGIPNPFRDHSTYSEYEHEYFNLMNKFSFADTTVIIYKDGVEEFRGYIDPKNKSGIFEKRSFELTAISDFSKLKDIDVTSLDPGDLETLPHNSYGNTTLFTDIIKETIKLVLPNFANVFFVSDLKCETNYTFLGQPWIATPSYFGDFSYRYWGNQSFGNAIDLIKSICSQLGCLGILKGNDFIMQSRFNIADESFITLRSRDMVLNEGPQIFYSRKMLGLKVVDGRDPDDPATQGTYGDYDNAESSERELIKFYSWGGHPVNVTPPNPLLREDIWILVPGWVSGLNNEQWVTSRGDYFYGGVRAANNQTALWRVVAESIWDQIQYDRLVYQLEMKGTAWQYDKYYQFENGLSETFRARKLKYNFGNKSTILDLIKC